MSMLLQGAYVAGSLAAVVLEFGWPGAAAVAALLAAAVVSNR